MRMCRLTLWSPALTSTSRTSTSPTMAPIAAWHPTPWERRTTTTSSTSTVGIHCTRCLNGSVTLHHTGNSVCIADPERFIDFAPRCSFCAVGGLYWNYKDLLQRLCDKQNHISNIYGCTPLLWGTESLKSQKLAAVDKSTELRIGFWDLSCRCTINA